MKKFNWPLLGLLAFIFASYLLTLNKIPPGLTNDEADIGYEAYSISLTTRDQWGNFLPLQYFSGFGGTRLPFIVYWTVPFIKIFGLNTEAVRIAGVSAAVLVLVGVWALIRKIYNNFLATTIVIILLLTPWFWGLTRTTNEAVPALALTVWGIWFLIKGEEKPKFLLSASLLFGLSAYAYYSSQIFIPLFLSMLLAGWQWLYKEDLQSKIWAVLLFVILISPLLIKTINGGGSAVRLGQTALFGNVALVGELNVRRGDCQQWAPSLWCKAIYNKPSMWLSQIGANYLNHFSLAFLFRDNWFVGILPPGKLYYWVLLPGLFAALYYLASGKIPKGWLWISWLVAAPVADSLTGDGHAIRAFLMLPPIVVLSVLGWKFLLSERKLLSWRRVILTFLTVIFLMEAAVFLSDYWWYFPKKYSVYSHYQYKPLINYLLSVENDYPAIYVSNESKSVMQYVFYLFYGRYNPVVFQQGKQVEWEREKDGWIWVKRIGKWHFVKSLPLLDSVPYGSLLVGTKDEIRNSGKSKASDGMILLLKRVHDVDLLSGDNAFIAAKVEKFP